jgi:CDP-diacylglycerol--glycerol-3-phosphate 3-phosphatidyltransferase
MRTNIGKEEIPWAMTAGRALLGPALIAGEVSGWNGLTMAWLVVAALASDIFDGVLARRWRCDTAGVRLFDSMADTVFYGCAAIALWIGQPHLLRANAGLLAALLALEAARFVVDFAKFGKPASYHSYLAKTWGLVMATAVVAAFAAPEWRGAGASLAVSLALGIVCDVQGLAMSLMLPVWRKDVKGLRAAWEVRRAVQGSRFTFPGKRGRPVFAGKGSVAIAGLLVVAMGWWAAAPALAMEPGQAAYAGGTAGIAQDTPGTLDTTSATELVFQSKAPGRTGEIAIPYAKIRTFEARNDVVRHLGFLPTLGAGLVAARQRRYTLAISYADASNAMQVAILQVAERDQHALEAILRARAPKSCMVTQYSNSCAVARPVPATAATAPGVR